MCIGGLGGLSLIHARRVFLDTTVAGALLLLVADGPDEYASEALTVKRCAARDEAGIPRENGFVAVGAVAANRRGYR